MYKKQFLIKAIDQDTKRFYEDHDTFHDGDAGVDLFTIRDTLIPPNETRLIDLGIKCQSRSIDSCIWKWFTGEFYKYHSYLLLPRSSISKTPLIMHNSIGLIDESYLGSIKVPLYNTSSEPFVVERGKRYVQLVNGDLSPASFKLVDEHRYRYTSRGEGGIGSTGQ